VSATKATALLASVIFAVVSTASQATEDFCAVVLKTPDGFLALREKPETRSKMIAKLDGSKNLVDRLHF
jgi:hypothetical protein